MIQTIFLTLITILFTVVILLNMFKQSFMFIFFFIKGLMLGALYETEDFPEENITEHTVQVALLIVTFTFMWETTLNKLNTGNES